MPYLKTIIIMVVILFNFNVLLNAEVMQKIESLYGQGKITYTEKISQQFYRIVKPSKLPITLQNYEKSFIKCGTLTLLEINENWTKLSKDFQKEYKKIFSDNQNDSYSYNSDHFTIYWGDNLEDNTDSDQNGVPDTIDIWSSYFENTWDQEVTNMGYPSPLSSGQKYSIFIGNTWDDSKYSIGEGVYGYTAYQGEGASFIVVREDYTNFPNNNDPEGIEKGAMKVTAAHEFHHAIQMFMDQERPFQDRIADRWWMEATSVWMEDAVYDQVDDYINYLNNSSYPWVKYPHTSLTLFNGIHEYGDVIWSKYISETYADYIDVDGSDSIKFIWQNIPEVGVIAATELFFSSKNTSLQQAFEDFVYKNLFMDYEEGANYGQIIYVSEENHYPVTRNIEELLPDYLGSNYILMDIDANIATFTVSFNGEDSFNNQAIIWRAFLVKQKSTNEIYFTSISLDANNQGIASLYKLEPENKVYLGVAVVSPTNIDTFFVDYEDYPNGVPYTYAVHIEEHEEAALPVTANKFPEVLNYPNPFSEETIFPIKGKDQIEATIKIYNTSGEKIKTIKGKGVEFDLVWDGKDSSGRKLANDVYFYVIKLTNETGNTQLKKGKCALLR